MGKIRSAKYFASPRMDEPLQFTIALSGTSCLRIFGRPESLDGTNAREVSFFDQYIGNHNHDLQ
jgi:hypothetical protein